MSVLQTFDRARASAFLADRFRVSGGSIGAFLARTERLKSRYADPRIKQIERAREARRNGDIYLSPDALKRISQEVLKIRRLIHVSPDAEFENIHRQLLQAEKVHTIVAKGQEVLPEHIEELLANRIGSVGMDTDCQALIVPTYNGPQVLAQIFRFHAEVPTDEQGRVFVNALPHSLEGIKNKPVAPMTGKENVTGYWTISAVWPGSGPVLIADLHEAAEGRFETTISPIRDHLKALSRDSYLPAMDKLEDDYVRYNALAYLEKGLKDRKRLDGVMNFHLSNGAFIGWIHVNPHSDADWIAVNYIYDRAELERNKAIYKSGALPVSEALQPFGNNVVAIQSERLAASPMPRILTK